MNRKKMRIQNYTTLIFTIIIICSTTSMAAVTWPATMGNTLTAERINYLHIWNTDGENITSNFTGNVGIGTTSPYGKLDVVDTAPSITLKRKNNTQSQSINFQNSGSSFPVRIYTTGSGNADLNFAVGTSNADPTLLTDRLTIKNNGYIGIGTTIPWSNFSVYGRGVVGDVDSARQLSVGLSLAHSVSIGYYQTGVSQYFAGVIQAVDTSNPTFLALNPSGGNVGIGTINAISKLQVAGNVSIEVGGSPSKVVCWKNDGKTLGYCSSIVSATGGCTCN